MGYSIELIAQDFFLPAQSKDAALLAVKALADKKGDSTTVTSTFKMIDGKWEKIVLDEADFYYQWVDPAFAKVQTLEQALECWRWKPACDADGNIIGLEFTGDKQGDELILFRKLARFIREGSFLELKGEDGKLWRYLFEKSRVRKVPQKAQPPDAVHLGNCSTFRKKEQLFKFRIFSLHPSYVSREAMESSLRAISASCELGPLGRLHGSRVFELKPGELARLFSMSQGGVQGVVLSIKPKILCTAWWPGDNWFLPGISTCRFQLDCEVDRALGWDFAERLFKISIEQMNPIWGELNDPLVVTESTSIPWLVTPPGQPPQNGRIHVNVLPHLNSANYFGPDYLRFFGRSSRSGLFDGVLKLIGGKQVDLPLEQGFRKVDRAGFARVEQLAGGVVTVMPPAQTLVEFASKRVTIEANLTDLRNFQWMPENQRPYFHEWDE